jgi:acetyl-CoA carboxylase carboxyl transferase subunit alpha
MKFGIIDTIVKEPVGGAHRDGSATMQAAGDAIEAAFAELSTLSPEAVRQARRTKFLAIGRDLKP